jgi:hypothetical protein
MAPMACPMCVANAPVEVAWSLLGPRLDEWWDARARRVTPPGPLAPGQRLELSTGPVGMFKSSFDVMEVGPVAHRLHAIIRLPFGVKNDETITMAPLGPDRCHVSFG